MKITVADLVMKYLEAEGVEYIFGVPGRNVLPLGLACLASKNIKPILAKNEHGASFMADGYARVKKTLGVCYSTSGPGANNMLSGIANAYADHIPVLALTGQVETTAYGKGTFQDSSQEGVDSVALFNPITKHSSMIVSKYKAEDEIRQALRSALTGTQGPVHLSIPKDIAVQEIEADDRPPVSYQRTGEFFDRRLVIEAAEQLVNAKNPVILVGAGVVASGACGDVQDLAEMLQVPVATSPKAKGAFPETHPLALGVLGFCGSPLAEHYVKSGEIDVLFVVGASLDQLTTTSWDPKLAPTKCLIQLNIDPTEIGKNYRVDIPLVGDAKTVINEVSFRVLRHLTEREGDIELREKKVAELRDRIGKRIEPEKMTSESVPVKPQRLIREMQEGLPDDTIFFVDTGNHLCWALHYLEFAKPGCFIAGLGMATMGYAAAAAIGGKLAAPDRPVVALVGDGCFMMNGMEVAAAADQDIPVIWIIQNNAKLGLIESMQKFAPPGPRVPATFKRVDFAKVAEGLGAVGYRVERPGELKALLPKVLESKRPTVIDCIIDPDEIAPVFTFVEGAKAFSERLNFM
ncbi:MAG: acetolactate synthase large subunit [Candidatus Hydrogenedentes bacterium]|nr:acetolactate synthase large subunit [Candidatus Hydrogenedentota bacterium]